MKKFIQKIRVAAAIMWSGSYIVTTRRGENVTHAMDCNAIDPIVDLTMRKVGEVIVDTASILQAMDEAGDAVSKLKEELGIPGGDA